MSMVAQFHMISNDQFSQAMVMDCVCIRQKSLYHAPNYLTEISYPNTCLE